MVNSGLGGFARWGRSVGWIIRGQTAYQIMVVNVGWICNK